MDRGSETATRLGRAVALCLVDNGLLVDEEALRLNDQFAAVSRNVMAMPFDAPPAGNGDSVEPVSNAAATTPTRDAYRPTDRD